MINPQIDLGGDGADNDEVPKNPDGISLDSDDDDDAEAEVICATRNTNEPNSNSRSHLDPPSPKNTYPENTDSETFTIDASQSNKSDDLMPEQALHDCSVSEPQRKVMKLKRRNQALYTSNDNTEDSDD